MVACILGSRQQENGMEEREGRKFMNSLKILFFP